jgi:hypothetical protein
MDPKIMVALMYADPTPSTLFVFLCSSLRSSRCNKYKVKGTEGPHTLIHGVGAGDIYL